VPSRHSLREESDPTARAPFSPSTPYPPNLVEVLFSEVRIGPVQHLGAYSGLRCLILFTCTYWARGER
jgi:hypothetical protein